MAMTDAHTLRKSRSPLNGYLPDATKVFRHGFGHGSDPKMITVSMDRRERREATASHKPLDRLGPVDVWCGGL